MSAINGSFGSSEPIQRLGPNSQRQQNVFANLSSGQRINRGSDDPAGLISSEALRAVIADHRAAGGIVIASTHIDLGLTGAIPLDMRDAAVSFADQAP